MSGAIKHTERSHKTRNRNYSEFRRFERRASGKDYQRQLRKGAFVEKVASGIKAGLSKLFKRQAKGDK